jgi:hypothetical protein
MLPEKDRRRGVGAINLAALLGAIDRNNSAATSILGRSYWFTTRRWFDCSILPYKKW